MAKIIGYTCPGCQQKVTMAAPPQHGVYKVTCPHCGYKQNVRIMPKQHTPSAPVPAGPQVNPKQQAQEVARHAPTVNFSSVGLPQMGNTPLQPSVQATSPLASQPISSECGKLSLVRIGKDKLEFPLHPGDNIIGRKDISSPCDVEIEGDNTMSRRSICLSVVAGMGGYQYTVRVLKALNPVLVNSKPIEVGASVGLSIGGSIYIGNTMLRLVK